MSTDTSGRCLCKKVEYTLLGKPKRVGCCYCKSCQIKSGSDHVVYLVFEAGSVDIKGSVTWYESTGDSGKIVEHSFCSCCGTTLFAKPELWPHIIIVYAGSLLDSTAYEPEVNLWTQEAPH